VEQSYKNTSTTSLELTFKAGLGEQVVVADFEIECNGVVSKGVVQGSSEARDTYDDAISSGGVAAIGERSEAGVFSLSIGNLQPDQQLKIRVVFLSPLAGFRDKLFFGLPAELFPDVSNKYNLSIKSKVAIGQPALSTFYHGNKKYVSHNGTFATTLLPQESQLFAVQIDPGKAFEPVSVVERSLAHKTLNACLTFFPTWDHLDEDLLTPYVEVIFLVDRSGSMGGRRIQAASRTLSLFLSSLPENTMFNICGFGTGFEYLFRSGSVKYDAKTRATAQKHVDSLAANLGGTNLLEPLQDILSKETSAEFPRAVFVLTDGQVSNRPQVISTVENLAYKNHARVFARKLSWRGFMHYLKHPSLSLSLLPSWHRQWR
jgi:von Willebrand factor A domain-containing protein 5